jgi:dihydrofolate reductase
MPKIKLFIATTLDGFIARENGSLDWLEGSGDGDQASTEETPSDQEKHDGGYGKFIADIDVLIMGRKTYEKVLDLGVEWPYSDQKTYVVTSNKDYKTKTDNTFVLNELNEKVIEEMKTISKKNIWLVGGGQLITEFINHDAVDEMTITIIPIILGKGIRLFTDDTQETKLELVDTESWGSGMVNLTYKKKTL